MPPLDNPKIYPNLTENQILNYTTPKKLDGNYDTCYRYFLFKAVTTYLKQYFSLKKLWRFGYNLSRCTGVDLSCVNQTYNKIECDNGYYYSQSTMHSTSVTEVCLFLIILYLPNKLYQWQII